MAVLRSDGQGRVAVVGGRVHLGALGLEEPHDLEVAVLRSDRQGHDLDVAERRSGVQGRAAVLVGRVHLGALGHEEPHDLEVAVHRSDAQGRAAVVGGRFYLGALGPEEPHDFEVAEELWRPGPGGAARPLGGPPAQP